jgi:hypothetical protein
MNRRFALKTALLGKTPLADSFIATLWAVKASTLNIQ